MTYSTVRVAIPVALTLLRLALGPIAVAVAITSQPRWVFAPLLAAGLLSDIFDGVLARRLGVARPWLRRFDSGVDLIYYSAVFVATWVAARETLLRAILPMALIAGSEVAVVVVSLARFRAFPATHTYGAEIYGLVMFAAFVAVLAFRARAWPLWVLAGFALAANAEIALILARSSRPPVDVLSIFHLKR